MLPQAVLCSPPQGGRKHHRAAAAFTLEQVQRWLDGERAAPPAVLPLDDLPVAPLLDLENVAQALQSFPADTAPGPSGLRVQHLRDALQNGGRAGLLDQLTLACASVAPLLAGAGLVAASAR